jgi:hypothetical protein
MNVGDESSNVAGRDAEKLQCNAIIYGKYIRTAFGRMTCWSTHICTQHRYLRRACGGTVSRLHLCEILLNGLIKVSEVRLVETVDISFPWDANVIQRMQEPATIRIESESIDTGTQRQN